MRKQLSITLTLVFAVACKTDPASSTAPSGAPSGETGAPSSKVRSGKIDVKPVRPALPASDDDDRFDAKPDRGDWRKRRDAKLDTNGDGVVSDEERAAAMKQRATAMRDRLDADGDGKLTPAELANAPGRMHFDDPAALDTNHDGDISADELAAGIKAKRDARRAARNGGGDPAPAAPAPAAGSSATP
ncbi:MAG TPA: hypothetical protein VH165_29245 [Kofleriaceae bacterium]|jgi:hypothetical protein|nr:hypothetical protein [Kofleriaceae bacterium]